MTESFLEWKACFILTRRIRGSIQNSVAKVLARRCAAILHCWSALSSFKTSLQDAIFRARLEASRISFEAWLRWALQICHDRTKANMLHLRRYRNLIHVNFLLWRYSLAWRRRQARLDAWVGRKVLVKSRKLMSNLFWAWKFLFLRKKSQACRKQGEASLMCRLMFTGWSSALTILGRLRRMIKRRKACLCEGMLVSWIHQASSSLTTSTCIYRMIVRRRKSVKLWNSICKWCRVLRMKRRMRG